MKHTSGEGISALVALGSIVTISFGVWLALGAGWALIFVGSVGLAGSVLYTSGIRSKGVR